MVCSGHLEISEAPFRGLNGIVNSSDFWFGNPVFTQVIIDKVLVHKGVTTLDVLAIGLITVVLFEALLNILRTYLFTIRRIVSIFLSHKTFQASLLSPSQVF